MVSLRRRKLINEMAEGEKRRSARLVALEEVRSEKAVLALPVDPQYQKRGRKRIKRPYEQTQALPGAIANNDGNLMNNPSLSRNPVDRIIGYFIDFLEVNDSNELFCMPDDLQAYDYEESINKPTNFATLRQKYTDRMYSTLDHFENDVATVYGNAMDSNAPDSIPFYEAKNLWAQAKQIFQSFRNNITYAELELASWHQDYFKYKKTAVQNDPNMASSSRAAAAARPESSSQVPISAGMRENRGAVNVPTRGRPPSSSRRPASSTRPRGRRATAAPTELERPQIPEEERRNTYKTGKDSDSLFTVFSGEPKSLVYNTDTLSYQESIRRFVKDAGPVAKLIAEQKCLEYSRRMQAYSLWRPSAFGSQSHIGSQPPYFPLPLGQTSNSLIPGSSSQSSEKFEFQSCELHTDELLSQFSTIGTPEFHRSSIGSSLNQNIGSVPRFGSFVQGMNQIGQSSSFNPDVQNAIWQPRLGGSKPLKEKEKEPEENEMNLDLNLNLNLNIGSGTEASSSATSAAPPAGLYQNRGFGFPSYPGNFNMFGGRK